jgi:hypothetical protein
VRIAVIILGEMEFCQIEDSKPGTDDNDKNSLNYKKGSFSTCHLM